MWVVAVKFVFLILLTSSSRSTASTCASWWFDCGNGKCISEIWRCDGENDCGNFNDENDCENTTVENHCVSSQFQCKSSDNHCIPQKWYCDGDQDCIDGSDEIDCSNATQTCIGGFVCRNKKCIPARWYCDGNDDCEDGSDEELCPRAKLCNDSEFLCSSGSCIPQRFVCNTKKDCADGSDEGPHCGDPCEKANCSQNCKSTPSGPQCYCNEGYALNSKDNKTCNDIDECQQEGFCSHDCTNTVGSYKCRCHDGYELVNRTCRAVGADPLLIYSNGKEVRGISLRSNQFFPVATAVSHISAVDVDPTSQKVYWIDVSDRSTIYTAKTDGDRLESVLSHGLLIPEDIAVDYVTKNMYITDSGLRQVLACKADGTMCHVLHTNVEKPRSIVIDPDSKLMYWSDWGDQTPGIFRSGMDGSRRISMVSNRIAWPNGIALDHTTNRLYWADAKLHTIEFITLDGTQRTVLLNTTVFHPYSLAIFEDTLYWSDWNTFSLESCNKFTGHRVKILARQSTKIMGVHVYHPVLISKASNPCWSNDCSHMCVMSPVKSYVCACPHGFTLSSDQKTCIKEQGESVFVSEGSSVFYINPKMVGSESVTKLPLPLGDATITRVTYDSKLRFMFVADAKRPAIYAINMTSFLMRDLVSSYIGSPEDLSFDWKSNNLYWIDRVKRTAEVFNINLLRRVVILRDLQSPVALAISPDQGYMFISTLGARDCLSMYDMDGKNQKILYAVQGLPVSLTLHPSKSFLYWADPLSESISYVNYTSNRPAQTIKTKMSGVISISVSEEYIYWTSSIKRELIQIKGDTTYLLQLPGQGKGEIIRKVTYSAGVMAAGLSMCLVGNGGCSYVCLTSPAGRTCACSSEMILSADNVTCVARECAANDFRCVNGRCLPAEKRCDGTKDCSDGSDEVGCRDKCSADDFQCKNGHCILKSWRCDFRDDCGDNSDEQDCPPVANCSKHEMTCLDGACVPVLWRCDGDYDCPDSSDEMNCNATRCNSDTHFRCDHGKCISTSWICDGTEDCLDGSDEKNCSKPKGCTVNEFQCESNGACIDHILRCNGKPDCTDSSDEKHCLNIKPDCKTGFSCKDGTCLYDYEICDGHSDCKDNEDEKNCTHEVCQSGEVMCAHKRCISTQWICDGDEDCIDGSDEENCVDDETHKPTLPPVPDCDGFYCYATDQCLPWSKVCDGRHDCKGFDEGGFCSRSCTNRNDGCSHVCKKTPYGPKCLCNPGYSLLPDNKTCDDLNECLEPGTCSHFCTNTRGGFKCSCAEGYALHNDNRFCKAEGGSATLVYLLGSQMKGLDLSSRSQRVYINIEDNDMKGMDYDATESVFYWTEVNYGLIYKYSVSTGSQEVIYESRSRPVTVRYDWIAENLYYLDKTSSIGVCTKDGKVCETLIHSRTADLDSMTIAPTFGIMFWTVWANSLKGHYSGIVERADMDGSHRMPIVSDKLLSPTGITVDHVLEMLYWSDREMNVLECSDFRGFKRRIVVPSGAYHPHAVAVFEDYLYWADWGSDSIMRCHKFNKEECETVQENNVKAHILLVTHRSMQPKAPNKCLEISCDHICVLTSSDPVCICDDPGINKTCKAPYTDSPPDSIQSVSFPYTTTISTSTEPQCPEGYCPEDVQCTVVKGRFICNCPYPSSGERCDATVAANVSNGDNRWIIGIVLAIIVTGLIVLLIFVCIRNREKLQRVGESVTVKFRNPKSSHDDRLVMEIDDGNVCEELVLEHNDYEEYSDNSDYMLKNSEKNNCVRSYERDSQRVVNSIVDFFRNLQRRSNIL